MQTCIINAITAVFCFIFFWISLTLIFLLPLRPTFFILTVLLAISFVISVSLARSRSSHIIPLQIACTHTARVRASEVASWLSPQLANVCWLCKQIARSRAQLGEGARELDDVASAPVGHEHEHGHEHTGSTAVDAGHVASLSPDAPLPFVVETTSTTTTTAQFDAEADRERAPSTTTTTAIEGDEGISAVAERALAGAVMGAPTDKKD